MYKHRKILLLFFLGIGSPSLLLGYLALRGIQNDQALLEKERLSKHRNIAQQMVGSIDAKILEIEQVFSDATANHQELQHSVPLDSLESLKDQQAIVEAVFLLGNSGQIQLPLARMLFIPEAKFQPPSIQPSSSTSSKMMQTGQQYEFQQENYGQALISYRQALTQASQNDMKGELLNAIARVQKKLDRPADAVESYRKIIQVRCCFLLKRE